MRLVQKLQLLAASNASLRKEVELLTLTLWLLVESQGGEVRVDKEFAEAMTTEAVKEGVRRHFNEETQQIVFQTERVAKKDTLVVPEQQDQTSTVDAQLKAQRTE